MPAYDYRCTACDHVFEVKRPVGATRDESCPVCNAPTKRIFSPVGVVFKGTGFHNTDYRPRPTEPTAEGSKTVPEAAPCAGKKDTPACSTCPASSE